MGKLIFIVLVLVGLFLLITNNQNQPTIPVSTPSAETGKAAPLSEFNYSKTDPDDFFPTTAGTMWEYDITLGQAEPLFHRLDYWPTGGDMVQVTKVVGRYVGPLKSPSQKNFTLKLTVLGPALTQGPLRYPEGVELQVLQDDLGIYRDAKNLYWAITRSGRYSVTEVIVLDGNSPGAPHMGPWGLGIDGHSMRVAFFGAREGTSIGFGQKPVEYLRFDGYEKGCLHFHRQYTEDEETASRRPTAKELAGAIQEDLFFEMGKGLVLLQQTVDGKLSMTWRLARFQDHSVM